MRFGISIIIVLSLILQTALPYPALAADISNPNQSGQAEMPRFGELPFDVTAVPNKLEQYFNRFMAALAKAQNDSSDQPLPPTINDQNINFMGMAEQYILVPTNSGTLTYRLGKSLLALPTPTVSNIFTQTEIALSEGKLYIKHKYRNLTQVIEGFDFVSFKADEQFIWLLSRNGSVHAMSIRFMKKFLFQAPVPIFENLAKLDGVPESGETPIINVISENSGPTHLSQDLEDEMAVPANQKIAFNKRDVFINLGRTTVAVYDRADLVEETVIAAKYLALLCYQNNPRFFQTDKELRSLMDQSSEHLAVMQSLAEDPKTAEFLKSEEAFKILSSVPPYVLKDLLAYFHQVLDSLKNGDQRKRILMEEFVAQFEKQLEVEKPLIEKQQEKLRLAQKIKNAQEKLNAAYNVFLEKTNDVILKAVTSQNLNRIAKGLLILGGVAAASDLAGETHIAMWSLSFAAQFWHNKLPTLSTPGLGMQTVKAVGLLASAPLLYIATGYLGGLLTGKPYKDFLSHISFKFYAAASGYFHGAGMILNQKNLITAERRGINPLTHFKAWNNPLASNDTIAGRRSALEEQKYNELKADNAAWLLAHAIMFDKENIDPVACAQTEIRLAQERADRSSLGVLEKKRTDMDSKDESRELSKLALGIKEGLKDLKSPQFLEELRKIPKERFLNLLEQAQSFHKEMKEDSTAARYTRETYQRIKLAWLRDLPRGLGVFTSEAFQDLFHAEGNDALMNQNLRIFKYAFVSEILLMSVMGSYADVSKPDGLLANSKDGILGINRGVFAQQLQSVIFLALANPARMFLDFQLARDPTVANPTNDQLIQQRQERNAKFLRTAGQYVKNFHPFSISNLARLNFGYYAVRHFSKAWLMITASITMADISRLIAFGNFSQSHLAYQMLVLLGVATMSELFRNSAAWLSGGWLWGLETRTLTMMDTQQEGRRATLLDAQFKINQGIRENSPELVAEGAKIYLQIVDDNNRNVPEWLKVIPQLKDKAAPKELVALADDPSNMELARQFLSTELSYGMVPDRPSALFMFMVTVTIAFVGNHLSTSFFKVAYDPKQTFAQVAEHLIYGMSVAAIAFPTLAIVQKGINRLHEAMEDSKRFAVERNIILPEAQGISGRIDRAKIQCELIFANLFPRTAAAKAIESRY